MDPTRRLRLTEDIVRRFAGAVRTAQLYAPAHPLVHRSVEALGETLLQLVAEQPSVAIGIVGDEIIVADTPVPNAPSTYAEFMRRLRTIGVERVAFDRGVTIDELSTLISSLAHPERLPGRSAPGVEPADALAVLNALPHVQVGRISLDDRVVTSAADVSTIRRLYADAVRVAQQLWDSAEREGQLDPAEALQLVDNLAQAVAQNRTALVALTALKDYDNYTFTHMVNVSILTMAQARSLGLEGSLLREFGLAALMHDIGKVHTPPEILNKPDTLDEREFSIIRLHVVDGAEILRHTPDIPALAPVVAFEHHLRLDGSGYPTVTRSTLNLGTMLCSIADVYDAMRSKREYQQAFATDRILAVLRRNDGVQFDQHLVRRFSQLMGIYPPGNLVRLDSGEVAVVLRVYASDPYRPKVRVIMNDAGTRLPQPYDVNLWEMNREVSGPHAVLSPLDPALYGIDPLTFL